MASDLADAWGEDEAPPAISARAAASSSPPASSPPASSPPKDLQDPLVQQLLTELAEMRREQSRRGAILLVAGCLVSVYLINYLDRLHRQLGEAVYRSR